MLLNLLCPSPFVSQSPNCPSALPAVVRVLAESLGLPFEAVALATGENSRAFFGMDEVIHGSQGRETTGETS